jgi:anti-sigma B factor antagonist
VDHPDQRPDASASVAFIRDLGTATAVFVSGEIDALSAPRLRNDVLFAVEAKPPALVIDLTEVEFLASAGLEVLVAARFAAAVAMPIVVVAASPVTRRPIELTGVHKLVPLYSTLVEALDALPA